MNKFKRSARSSVLSVIGLSSLLFVSVTTIQSATAGGVYRWVDEQGAVHYGDRKPDGVDSQTVKVQSGTSSKTDNPIADAEALDKKNAADAEQTYRSEHDEKEKAVDQDRCRVAKDNLNTLTTRPRIMVEEDGKRRYLTPEEIEAKKSEFQTIVDKECQP